MKGAQIIEYLKRILGIRVQYNDGSMPSMPNYIRARYRIQEVALDGKKAVFVFPKKELESVNTIKKHLGRIESVIKAPAVLILNHLEYRQKEYLLRDHISFIVEGKQIYLPFMAIYMQERCDSEKKEISKLLPSAQLLFLHFICSGSQELLTSDAAMNLSLSSMSISRASRQLEDLGLIKTEKRGVQKVIISNKEPKELYEFAKPYLMNPVKRTIYIKKPLLARTCC